MEGRILNKKSKLIAACGLNCVECDIYLAQNNLETAQKLVEQFDGMWEDVKVTDFHCSTCKGDQSECWTSECWIRDCCLENKKLEFCYECKEFPCIKLIEWSKQSENYAKALQNLKDKKEHIKL
jgi:hypothetical protein